MKLGLLASALAVAGVFTFAALSSDPASAGGDGCVHKELKTDLLKAACAKGGQAEAKAVMKTFMKDHKIKSCNQCHTKLAPSYDLKADGLDQFQKAGGK
ncbi:MAG TPA: hypothetical protein VGM88_01455 [Kofleriaceae bacterium]|jgi:hypothetical protein